MELLAALPYYQVPAIPLGPLDLQPFGILVATGVLFGAWIGRLRGRQLGIDENQIRTLTGYLLVVGFLGAHWFDVLFYQFDELKEDPLLLLKVWDGISSYGGFIGAAVGFWLFCRVHKVERPLVYADITITGTLPGFTFGRLGCTIVFDHPGQPTDLWTGMEYPFGILMPEGITPGTTLHNLGFYEFVFLVALIAVLLAVTRAGKARPVGFIPGFVALTYGVVRFMLDDLRYNTLDPRYWGLTFAQWVSVATAAIGIATLWRAYKGPKWVGPEGESWDDVEKELDEPEVPKAKAQKKKPQKTSTPKKKSVGAKKVGKKKKKKK